jgi:hypothetical protein
MDQLAGAMWEQVIKAIAAALGLGVTWLVGQAIVYLRAKKKIEVSEATKKKILDAATLGIQRAEEWGLKQLSKAKSTPPGEAAIELPTGEQKQQVAKEMASMVSPEFSRLPEQAKADYIDAKLFQMRSVSLLPALPYRPSLVPPDLSGTPGTVPKPAIVPQFAAESPKMPPLTSRKGS